MTHLHIKLVSGLECIYISEAGKENPKRGQIVRDKCLNSGSMAFGLAKVSANPSPLAVRYFDLVGGCGVVGGCSDGMPANLAVISFGLSIWAFGGRVIELGRGQVLGPGSFCGRGRPVCCQGLLLRTVERVGSRENLYRIW